MFKRGTDSDEFGSEKFHDSGDSCKLCDSGNFEEYGESSDSRVPCHSGESGNSGVLVILVIRVIWVTLVVLVNMVILVNLVSLVILKHL